MATPAKRLLRPSVRPTRRPDWATSRPTYRPHQPAATPLYPVVRHHLETFLAQAAESDPLGHGVPAWVEKDFRAYLRCGILAHGLARARCADCGHERLIAFSCKGRGICPSCNVRRMAELAAHLTDHALPHLSARQGVLSLPKRHRLYLQHNPEIAGAVLHIFLRAIRTTLRTVSPAAPRDAQLGAVSFLRASSVCSATVPDPHSPSNASTPWAARPHSPRPRPGCSIASRGPRPTGAPESFSLPSSCSSASPGSFPHPACTATDTTILLHLDLPRRPPSVARARVPPQGDFLIDQTPAFDPADADPEPDHASRGALQFDQSLPPDLDD